MSTSSIESRRRRGRGRSAPKAPEKRRHSRTPREPLSLQLPTTEVGKLTEEVRNLTEMMKNLVMRQDQLEKQAGAVATQLSVDQRSLAAQTGHAVHTVANVAMQEIRNTQQGTEHALGTLAEATRTEFQRAGEAIHRLGEGSRRDVSPGTPPGPQVRWANGTNYSGDEKTFCKYKPPSPPKFALPLEGWLVEARIWHRAAKRQAPEDVLTAELAFSLGDVRCRPELFRRIEADPRVDVVYEVLRSTYGLLDRERVRHRH